MRAVAGELGVEAMSLYHHVPGGKDEMLDGVVAMVQAEFVESLDLCDEWRQDMGAFARAYRSSTVLVGSLFTSMEDAGFAREDALRAVRVVSRWTIGFTLGEASAVEDGESAEQFDEPLLVEVFTDIARGEADVFEFGLEALLDGLEARLS